MIKYILILNLQLINQLSINAQPNSLNSFQDFKMGMDYNDFNKKYPLAKVGEYSISDCKKPTLVVVDNYRNFDDILSNNESYTFKHYCIVKLTQSKETVYISLGFYKNKLGYINIIYATPQSLSNFKESLVTKYGKETSKAVDKSAILIPNPIYTFYTWERNGYELTFSYDRELFCKINTSITFTDKKMERIIHNDNLKRNIKRTE